LVEELNTKEGLIMYSIISHDGDVQYGINEYVCDSVDDLVILPRCVAGSIAIILEKDNPAVYMKNNQGEWVKL
jgi:hypothetical protein